LNESTPRSWGFGRAVGVALAGLLALATGVHAQSARIAPATITSDVITPEQDQEIDRFVGEHAPKLRSDDPRDVRDARRALLEPLGGSSVKVAFRLKYAERLMPELARLIDDPAVKDNPVAQARAIAALVIAGDLATRESVTALMGALSASRDDIRHQAAYGIRRVFEALSAAQPATDINTCMQAVRALRDRMTQEKNDLVLDAIANALLAGGTVEAANYDTLRPEAIKALSQGVQTIVRRTEARADDRAVLNLLLRASAVRDVIARSRSRMPADALIEAGAIGGDLVGFCVRAARAERIPMGEIDPTKIPPGADVPLRELFAQTSQAGETLILFVGQQSGTPGFDATPLNLGARLRTGTKQGDATFITDAGRLIGPQGTLTSPPYSLSPDRFAGGR
jgi:hypothetical protein